MANSNFQQARESILELADLISKSWTPAEQASLRWVVNRAFFKGEVVVPAALKARLEEGEES